MEHTVVPAVRYLGIGTLVHCAVTLAIDSDVYVTLLPPQQQQKAKPTTIPLAAGGIRLTPTTAALDTHRYYGQAAAIIYGTCSMPTE